MIKMEGQIPDKEINTHNENKMKTNNKVTRILLGNLGNM